MQLQKVHDRTTQAVPRHAMVVEAIVDDPYEVGAKLKVTRSVRDDPLAGLLARGHIDQAMYDAGRLWQKHHENSEIGGISAIDPTKEAVDGGRIPEPITDKQIKAFRALQAARAALGWDGNALICAVLGRCKSIQDYAMSLGMTTESEFKYIGRRLRECLDTLAKLWGFA